MNKFYKGSAIMFLSLALVLTMMMPALADHTVTVPVGTVVPLRMDTYLSSESSRVGDRFTATVFSDVIIDRLVAIPVNSKVEGHVTRVDDADRVSRAGAIAVAFDRLIFPNSFSVPVDGTLTTLNEEGRRRLEDDIDEENRVEGSSRTRRSIVFIGGGAGAGALIGAIAGGGKGAAVGTGIGAVLGTLGVLFSKGDKAEVRAGTEFGMMVERAFTVETDAEPFPAPSQTIFTNPIEIRSAQIVLRDRGYYEGVADGRMDAQMRAALRRFQRDQNISITGDLDFNTARALGITNTSGHYAGLVEIANADARRIDGDTIAVRFSAITQTAGWNVYTDHFAAGNNLHIYVRGVPPRTPAAQVIERRAITENYDNLPNITRVIFHGSNRELTASVQSGFSNSTGNARQIALLAQRLMVDYHRDLNIQISRGQLIFNPNRNFRENEVELLFQINTLQEATRLYDQMVGRVSDPDAIKGAADSVIRQARLVHRAMNRTSNRIISATVRNDWERLKNELARINIVNSNMDFLDNNDIPNR